MPKTLAVRIEEVARDLADHTELKAGRVSVTGRLTQCEQLAAVAAARRREPERTRAEYQSQEEGLKRVLLAARWLTARFDKTAIEVRHAAAMRAEGALAGAGAAATAEEKAMARIASNGRSTGT